MIADEAPISTTDAWLIVIFFGVLSPFLIWDARRFWRGPHPIWDGRPGAWDPFGPAYWHGFCRMIPLIAAASALGFTPLGLGFLVGVGGPVGIGLAVFGGFFFLFVLVPLCACVFFFNRPHWCVPPHRRDEPGALVEFRDNQRRRRAERRAARG